MVFSMMCALFGSVSVANAADSNSRSNEDLIQSDARPFDSNGKYIPIPVNPWPSIYELQRKTGDTASSDDIGIAPPVNPYPSNNTGDTSLGGFDPNKDYMKRLEKPKKKTNKSSINSSYKKDNKAPKNAVKNTAKKPAKNVNNGGK